MENFEKFKAFLEAKEYVFKEESLENGEKFIVMRQPVENGETLGIYCLFNDKQNILDYHIYNIVKIKDKEKRGKLLEILNEANEEYRFGKVTVNEEGEVLCAHSILLANKDEDFEEHFQVLAMMVDFVSESEFRRKLMRLQWE